jgi:5-methyltetrahydropteroyltriglutamate--homocysteine methyltransferase
MKVTEKTISAGTSNLGYPRIGADREWKKALEAFWSGQLEEAAFLAEMDRIETARLLVQKERGIDLIPVNDFTYYDHMLDMAVMFGAVPARYGYTGGKPSLAVYFAMARGNEHAAACEMTKWFNTNYHYIVPEIGDAAPNLTYNKPLEAYRFAKSRAGVDGKPVVVGLFTFLKLSKGFPASRLGDKLKMYTPVYIEMLKQLEQEGVPWVQIDEPSLVTDCTAEELQLVERLYNEIRSAVPQLPILVQTYFEAVDHYEQLVQLPVDAIGLDFAHDNGANLLALKKYGFPADKVLAAGVIDGRGIWRADLAQKLVLLGDIMTHVSADRLILQPSCSLLHVPVTKSREALLSPVLVEALAFAEDKLDEIRLLGQALREGTESVAAALETNRWHLSRFEELPERNRQDAASAAAGIANLREDRLSPFAERVELQRERWKLPLLPTTTIGSFPQTAEVRKARLKWRKGEWTNEQYESFMHQEIEACIRLQEAIGLDVLVHGEFERTDMVEFFGEKLAGFVFTQNGWVQSYGSRCVKPPVIYGDVAFEKEMTVAESEYAKSLTNKPMKGMLTGPITILNWSFVRDDISREQVAGQLALALRSEVLALESAGIGMIQVDEPALREGLPLKLAKQQDYLNWAIRAFKLATAGVDDATQIHTHMCYCEFHDMIDSILALDADVISIETSRSHGELVSSFENNKYDHGIGLGVYDIHSPRVPSVEEMSSMIDRALRVLDPSLFWINPDCGLKTRGLKETEPALRNMVEVAKQSRVKWGSNELAPQH